MTKLIAYYLPQFHPIPENDAWWGKGFTEWTNVTKARPLYKGHQQPKLPADLGFYDLRIPEVREQQAEMAKAYGIDAFCYWHYWFGNGKRLLERPFNEVVESGKPDFPFCLAWANVSWGGLPYGDLYERNLMEQKYPGKEDYINHFYTLLPAFKDKRYVTVNSKPTFTIYNPTGLPDSKEFIHIWNELAIKEGLPGIHFIAYQHLDYDYKSAGFDAITPPAPSHMFMRVKRKTFDNILKLITGYRWINFKYGSFKLKSMYFHKELAEANNYKDVSKDLNLYPSTSPNWDHTPRSGYKGQVIVDASPEHFAKSLHYCYERAKINKPDEQIIFIKAWNEWAEGNYLEPDQLNGFRFLEAIKQFRATHK